jgi:hypothetical protein
MTIPVQPPNYVRGQERLVYQTVYDYLFAQMTALGWFSTPAPFNAASPISQILEYVPQKDQALAPNTIAFTTGHELPDKEQELGASGGGLWQTDHIFFIDIYGESQGIAKQLSSDIKAILTGRLPGTNRFQHVTDYTATSGTSGFPSVAGHLIHFTDVEVETPVNQDSKRNWRVVKVTVEHQYQALEYEYGVF